MTDREKVQTIRMWINEAIYQGNRTVLVMAIKSILDLENDIVIQKGVVKLSKKSIEMLKAKKGDKGKCQISSMKSASLLFVYAEL